MKLATIFVDIVGRNAQLVKVMRQSRKSVSMFTIAGGNLIASFVENSIAAFLRLGRSVVRTFANMVRTVRDATFRISRYSVLMAADVIEWQNLFQVATGRMSKYLEDWANRFSRVIGLNRYEVQRNIATFYLWFTAMGFTARQAANMARNIAQVTYDIASLRNLDFEDVLVRIQSGLVGITRPIGRLGILIHEEQIQMHALTEGIIRQGQELTPLQKIFARYSLILKGAARDMGDMWRTAERAQNALRRLKARARELAADFGMMLIPTWERVLRLGHWLIDLVRSLDWRKIAVDVSAKVKTGWDVTIAGLKKFWSASRGYIEGFLAVMAGLWAFVKAIGKGIASWFEISKVQAKGLISAFAAVFRFIERSIRAVGMFVNATISSILGAVSVLYTPKEAIQAFTAGTDALLELYQERVRQVYETHEKAFENIVAAPARMLREAVGALSRPMAGMLGLTPMGIPVNAFREFTETSRTAKEKIQEFFDSIEQGTNKSVNEAKKWWNLLKLMWTTPRPKGTEPPYAPWGVWPPGKYEPPKVAAKEPYWSTVQDVWKDAMIAALGGKNQQRLEEEQAGFLANIDRRLESWENMMPELGGAATFA